MNIHALATHFKPINGMPIEMGNVPNFGHTKENGNDVTDGSFRGTGHLSLCSNKNERSFAPNTK